MSKYFLLLLTLTSCFSLIDEIPFVQTSPVRKQRHQIAFLQKKLKQAESDQKKALIEVEEAQEELYKAQLKLIEEEVARYEKKLEEAKDHPQKWAALTAKDPSLLFLEEREDLHQIIQTGPSPAAFNAQVQLDHILRLITQLSDESRF